MVFVAGCKPPVLHLPDAVTCRETVTAGPDAAGLKSALARAKPGTCVVAAAGTYGAALTVPADVTLAAEAGTRVVIAGDGVATDAVVLSPGANLSGIRVASAAEVGVWIDRGPCQLVDVAVEGARTGAVVAWCEEDCVNGPVSELHDVELTLSGAGLLAHGASVKMVGGRVAENRGTNLGTGYGVVASHGATLQMDGTVVEANTELGVLIDGDLGTQAAFQNVVVRNNLGRGIWVQALAGTAQAPKLELQDCTVEGNSLVGLGARASRGIHVVGGRIASTVMGKTSAAPGVLVDVGDGVGLFEGCGDVQVEDAVLESNQRSQVLIDLGATGLAFERGAITAQSGQLGVIVQHTAAAVQAPAIVVPAPGSELPFSAPRLAVPSP